MARITLGAIGPTRLRNLPAPELAGARASAKRLQGKTVPQAKQAARAEGYLLLIRWCDGACPESPPAEPDPKQLQAAVRKGKVVDAWAADDPRARGQES